MSIPRTGHMWLEPFYDVLEGRTSRPLQLGSVTGYIGLFGSSGAQRLPTGGANTLVATNLGVSGPPATGIGNSGLYYHLGRAAYNGGTGTPYVQDDVVHALKRLGALPW
jgi:hypothetical protein